MTGLRMRTAAGVAGALMLAATGSAVTAVAKAPLTYRVVAGTTKTGTVNYTGPTPTGSLANPSVTLTDARTSTPIGCLLSHARGTAKLGSSVPARIATVAATSYAGCTAFGGYVTLRFKHVGTWYVVGVSRPASGATTVALTSVRIDVTSPACNFTVNGVADASYRNSTHVLSVRPRTGSHHALKASQVSGCGGVINNGDVLTFVANYTLSTSKGALRIT